MAALSPFPNLDVAVQSARDIWFNKELTEWNAMYVQKFGFVFLICATGKSTAVVLDELKNRYSNRPIVELEIVAREQMKIVELRLAKLISARSNAAAAPEFHSATAMEKAGEDRVTILGAHLSASPGTPQEKSSQVPTRNRPPTTTRVLDMASGRPGTSIEVLLEAWKGPQPCLSFPGSDPDGWTLVGSGMTDEDSRSNPLMSIVDAEPWYIQDQFRHRKI